MSHGDPELLWTHEVRVGDLLSRRKGSELSWQVIVGINRHGDSVHFTVETGRALVRTEPVRRSRYGRVRVRRALVTREA